METMSELGYPRHVLRLAEIQDAQRVVIYECVACGRADERVRLRDSCARSLMPEPDIRLVLPEATEYED